LRRPFWFFHSVADRITVYKMLLPRLVDFLRVGNLVNGKREGELTDFQLDGVSERTFNKLYFNEIPESGDVPYNEQYNVDHFVKTRTHHIWSLVQEPEDAVVTHYSDDCFRVPITKRQTKKDKKTNKTKTTPKKVEVFTTSQLQPMSVFERLNATDPKLVSLVKKLPFGTHKKYGCRPVTGCVVRPQNMIRSTVKVPAVLKGPEHCNQRVLAALLHLQCNVAKQSLDTMFKLSPIINLGGDAHPVELNKCLRSSEMLHWMTAFCCRLLPELMPAVEGDEEVRHLLRNLAPNEAVYTYPVDFRGVGRHCSLVFRPAKGKTIMWDPSPTFDDQDECPVWTRYNETCLNFRSYAAARIVEWSQLPLQQSRTNSRRARCRKRKREKEKRETYPSRKRISSPS
jgi:hypothetical protein